MGRCSIYVHIKKINELGVVLHVCNPSIQEAETGHDYEVSLGIQLSFRPA